MHDFAKDNKGYTIRKSKFSKFQYEVGYAGLLFQKDNVN